MMKRRVLLTFWLGMVLALATPAIAQYYAAPWDSADAIVARVKAPVFKRHTVDITRFGAKGDGITDCSKAFAVAISACARKGGGRVLVPRGVFLTGAITLRSGIELHVTEGATVRFDPDPRKYLPLVRGRWEGIELLNFAPLICAVGATGVAVTGKGTLDGGGSDSTWWPWAGKAEHGWKPGLPNQKTDRDTVMAWGQAGFPVEHRVMGEGHFLRPNFIEMIRCRNVLISGVTIVNSPMWVVHPLECTSVTVRDITVRSHGPNNDGCDPESSTDVVIRGCTFDTGDDCIAIKSGRNNDGRRTGKPCRNIVIDDCMFKDGHGGITIGSEVSGNVAGVYSRRCQVESPVLFSALRLKNNAARGGTIEHVYLKDITVRLVARAAIDIDLFYEEGPNGAFLPTVRSIAVERMTVKACEKAFNLVGYENAPIRSIRLKDCIFEGVKNDPAVKNVLGFESTGTVVNGVVYKPPAQ
jgi:polygalacturonase